MKKCLYYWVGHWIRESCCVSEASPSVGHCCYVDQQRWPWTLTWVVFHGGGGGGWEVRGRRWGGGNGGEEKVGWGGGGGKPTNLAERQEVNPLTLSQDGGKPTDFAERQL